MQESYASLEVVGACTFTQWICFASLIMAPYQLKQRLKFRRCFTAFPVGIADTVLLQVLLLLVLLLTLLWPSIKVFATKTVACY